MSPVAVASDTDWGGRILVAAVLLVVGCSTAALAAGAATGPTIDTGSATIDTGERATIAVTLSSAPDGLSGYDVTVRVADPAVARVVDADVPISGVQNATVIDDTTAELRAVDVVGRVDRGATDVPLGTVTVVGVEPGRTTVAVVVQRVDDDDGDAVSPATANGSVTVGTTGSPPSDAGSAVATGATDAGQPAAAPAEPAAFGRDRTAPVLAGVLATVAVIAGVALVRKRR